ncbi:hypothetical protein T12_3792 [Trichinella patagoniensis]|uniref:Uncharacterized protein n=1 Tax=Trichinella patagoniensis TaxID=990121 RepID=A0A0V1A8S2_9BILA|nr:hypothetical protein T12_3792 [Trichinella patagoniensis]
MMDNSLFADKKDSGFHVNCCCQKTMTESNIIQATTMNTNLFNTDDHSTLIFAKSLPTARPYRSVAFKTWTVGGARNLFINNCQSLPTSGRTAVGCGSSGVEEKNNQLLGYYVNGGNYSAPPSRRCLNKSSTVLQSCSAVVEQSFHANDHNDRNKFLDKKITTAANYSQLGCWQSVDGDVSTKRLMKTLPKNLSWQQYKEHFVQNVHSTDGSYFEAAEEECSSNFIPKKTLQRQCRQWFLNTFKQMNSRKKKKMNNQLNFHSIGNSFTKKQTTGHYGSVERRSTAQVVECLFCDNDISSCDNTVPEPHCCISSAYFDFNAERLEKLKKQMATVRNDDIMLIHKLHQLEKEIFMKKQNIRGEEY